MKKLAFVASVIWFGFGLAAHAQLLYQWAFTNSSDTATSSIPNTYISSSNAGWSSNVLAGTGILGLEDIAGTAVENGNIFFTNANFGPPGGPGGALVLFNQVYNGNPNGVATNSNLTLGTLYQFTITFWVQYGVGDGSSLQLSRQVQFGASVNYDSGGKGAGNHNGVGTALNDSNGSETTVGYNQFQDGIANATAGSNPQVTITGDPNFANGFVCDGQTWYFEAITYDGTLTSSNFTVWLASTNASTLAGTPGVDPFVQSQNLGSIAFTTNASILLAGCTGAGRNIQNGQISDVRIYNGILTSNQLITVRQFGYPVIANQPQAAAILTQPTSGSTFVGGNRTFSVSAVGFPTAYTYLWRSNNVAIPGATNASFTLSNVTASANGANFICSVNNAVGGTNSAVATITVVTPAAGSFAQAVFTNNPYALWLVNEPTNATPILISDYANGNDGMAPDPANMLFQSEPIPPVYIGFPTNNTSIETPAAGKQGRLNMPPLPVYTNTGMSICGWVYTPTIGNGTAGDNGLIFSLPSDTANGFGLVFGPNNELDYQWGNGSTTGSGLTIPSAEWTFVALVISTNLSQQDLANSITADTNATLYIGSKSLGFSSYVDGTALTGHLIVNGTSAGVLALGRTTASSSENGGYYAKSNVRFNDVAVFYSALSPQTINNLFESSIVPPQIDTWVGNLSSGWDTITTNWMAGGAPALYSSGDYVLFNDTAATGNVNLTDTMLPGSITVSNNALPYVFSGGSIGGNTTLTKQGTNVLTLSTGNTYTGLTTIGNGTMLINGSISSNVDIVGGMLGGNSGLIYGVVTNETGGTLAPGATLDSVGTLLYVSGLTLLPGSTTVMKVSHNDGLTLTGDTIFNLATTTFTYGGTLMILTNAGDTTTYKVGDSVTLFYTGGGFTGSFASIQPAPGPGLAWSNDAVNLGQFDVIVAPPVAKPVAAFSGTPTNIFATQSILFTDASTPTDGSIKQWLWNFGDGSSVTNATGVSVSHAYASAGTYTVSLTVTNSAGSSTNTQPGFVVKPKPSISTTILSAGKLFFGGTNGPAGAQYRVLTSTNVILPLASWIPVWTNQVAADGSYGYTNSALTNQASFFRLVSP